MMSKRGVLAYLFVLIGFLALLFFCVDGQYTELAFSKESGFYPESFMLEMHAPFGTEIYYTLDGSQPDENAILYTEPILIEDATAHDNVYAKCGDMSIAFRDEVVKEYGFEVAVPYVLPDAPVDKCTVVRAAYRDADGNFSKTRTGSYFVGYDTKTGYEGLKIISLVTDPENFFGYDEGIYVLGHAYDAWDREQAETLTTSFWNANYNQRGIAWERPVEIQLFDTDGRLLLEQSCGARTHGGASRSFLPKSLNLYAREEYDGQGRFYIDLFQTGYMADKIVLDSSGNDYLAKVRDIIMAELVGDWNFATVNFTPCAVFLDGEYWGVYWLTEKYDAVYLADRYGVEKDNVIMIKSGELEEGTIEDDAVYEDMKTYLEERDLSDPDNYWYVQDLIDVQSYIDYYAAQIYIGHSGDWPGWNEALWRTREVKDGAYEDGRWRWMLYDTNGTPMRTEYIDSDTLKYVMEINVRFYNLCQNDMFQEQFVTTMMDLSNTAFAKERVDCFVSDYIDRMEEPVNLHLKRFYGIEDRQVFLDSVAEVENFLDGRKSYMVRCLKEDFGLSGTPAPVTLQINEKAAGSVTLNTITPEFDEDGMWSGDYFTDYPIELTAVAAEGYRFVRWESDALENGMSKEETIEAAVTEEGTLIRAVFEPVP